MFKDKSSSPVSSFSRVSIAAVAVTVMLVFLQFNASMKFEAMAQQVGVMDAQSRILNTTYLDYEEQSAILRSSKFLVSERASGYVQSPAKVLYVNPGDAVVSSND